MLRSIGVLLLVVAVVSVSGQGAYESVKGLPTEEVFDAFTDSKGFIWVGHSLGVSRYDGRVFRHFNSDEQTGLGMSRLHEDRQGRIWCHNFNGQIFYIENERMHLLKEYDPSRESHFPDITIIDSEFIATSNRGIFVCNTYTMKSRFISTPGVRGGTQTICNVRGQAIMYDNPSARAYRYIPGMNLESLFLYDSILGVRKNTKALSFSTADKNGVLYGFDNERTQTFSMVIRNDTLRLLSVSKAPGVINTIVYCNDTIWVNTKQRSYALGANDTIYGKNLTDIVKDNFWNRWQTSLQMGLQMLPSYKGWQKTRISYVTEGDFIRCMINWKGGLLYGTQNGKIILVKKGQPVMTLYVPPRAGSVENFFVLPNGQVVVAPSLGLYLADIETQTLFPVSETGTAKTLAITDTSILIGYAQTLAKISLYPQLKDKLLHSRNKKNFELLFKKSVRHEEKNLLDIRCLYVDYSQQSKETYALFKTGLSKIENDSIIPVLYENKPIRSVSLIQANDGVLYIGTLSSGLLIKTGGHFNHITTGEGLSSNTILKMKLFQDQLVLIEPGYMQIWDIITKRFIATIPLPKENTGTVYDFLVENGKVYLNFANSLYELQQDNLLSIPSKGYIMSVVSAKTNSIIQHRAQLSYDDNSIHVQFASPAYINPEATYFEYFLIGSNDSARYKLMPPYTLSLVSLKPGPYQLWARAVNFQGQSSGYLAFSFVIRKPVWQQAWFFAAGLFVIAVFLFLFFRRWIRNVKRRNALLIEKLTLQNDLRKSLLRTIVAQMNPHFIFNALNTIQSFVYRNDKRSASNYLGKFSELIRKILDTSNTDAITLEEEINILSLYLDLEKSRFEDSLVVRLDIQQGVQPGEIYIPPMFIQPFIENAIKHGLFHKKEDRVLDIFIGYDDEEKNYIKILVEDNGIGREKSAQIYNNMNRQHRSFATTALESRVSIINQTLTRKIQVSVIDKPDDTGTIVAIRLPLIKETI
jgi:hypothetical protein